MTKKHFTAIASIMKKNAKKYKIEYSTHAELIHNANCNQLADYFATVNPKFDSERFLAACGISEPN